MLKLIKKIKKRDRNKPKVSTIREACHKDRSDEYYIIDIGDGNPTKVYLKKKELV